MDENTASYLRLINDMLIDNEFNYAEGFLFSIKKYIEVYEVITTRQQKAIQNIFSGKEK